MLIEQLRDRLDALHSRIEMTSAVVRPKAATQSTPSAGISLRPSLPAGLLPTAVVTGDFNGDGHADFVVANGYTSDLWIYLGNGDGTFQLPSIIPLSKGLSPVQLATADLRGNGKLDLIVVEYDTSSIGVVLGNGDGTFGYEKEYPLPMPPTAVVISDLNHDGKPDLAAVMNSPLGQPAPMIAALIGDGTGGFAGPVITNSNGEPITATSISAADVNGDGLPDVLITGPGAENSQVYFNAGGGTFKPGPTVMMNQGLSVLTDGKLADVNGDGCPDAVVADAMTYVWVALGDCAGNFGTVQGVPMGDSNAAVQIADVNGDGHPDIVTSSVQVLSPGLGDLSGNTISIALGDGKGNFAPGRNYIGTGQSYSLALADFNEDGKPDVVTAENDTDTATVYLNDGAGGFGFPQGAYAGVAGQYTINSPVSGVSFADANGDGKPDAIFLDEAGTAGEYYVTTLLNDGTGRFAEPLASDTGLAVSSTAIGDYRIGDFRNSGHNDFVAIGASLAYSSGAQYIAFALGNGDGTFGKATLTVTTGADGGLTVGDFNHDGNLDLIAVGASSGAYTLSTFLGNGNGTFRSGAILRFGDGKGDVARVFTGDFNRDGKLDVLVFVTENGYWSDHSAVWEFLGVGDGTFQSGQQIFTGFQPFTLSDLNGDGLLDIARYDFMWPDGKTQTLGPAKFTDYLGQPSGQFQQSSSYAPYVGIPDPLQPYLEFGDPLSTSLVADLNGDGKPDEIAFQHLQSTSTVHYAQVLAGNGDGTFTPNYDVYPLYLNGFPKYAHDLDGDGKAELVKLVSGSSALAVFQTGAAPAIQIALESEQYSGSSGCGWVFLNLPSTSDVSISISSSSSGVVVPNSVTIPAGSLSQQFCFTLTGAYDWHQIFDIRAQLGNDTAVAYASQSYIFGFSEAIAPTAQQTVFAGQSISPVTVSLTPASGYNSTVQLSCEGLAAGDSCQFGSPSLALTSGSNASTSLVVSTSARDGGLYTITVVANDGNVVRRQTMTYTVLQIVPTLNPSSFVAIAPGQAAGTVTFSAPTPYSVSCQGLPPGVSCMFTGNHVSYPAETTLGINISIPSNIPAANYPFTVQVTNGNAQASAAATLQVQDFTMQGPQAPFNWGPPGATAQVAVSVQGINWVKDAINITCSLDAGGNCTGGTYPVTNIAQPRQLTVSVPTSAGYGTHQLTVIGTDSVMGLTHTYSFPFIVADFSGSVSSSAITMERGGTASAVVTVNTTAGFTDSVTLGCGGNNPQLTCTFSPSVIQISPGGLTTANLTITASQQAKATPANSLTASEALLLAFLVPFGIFDWRRRGARFGVLVVLLAVLIGCISCGSGFHGVATGPGGGSGSNTYSVPIVGTTTAGFAQRNLGTITVTVNHS